MDRNQELDIITTKQCQMILEALKTAVKRDRRNMNRLYRHTLSNLHRTVQLQQGAKA